jgi:hypothetical protein
VIELLELEQGCVATSPFAAVEVRAQPRQALRAARRARAARRGADAGGCTRVLAALLRVADADRLANADGVANADRVADADGVAAPIASCARSIDEWTALTPS